MKITYNKLANLYSALERLSAKELPIKWAVARNIAKIEQHKNRFEERKNELINKYAVLDEQGRFIAKPLLDEKGEAMPRKIDTIYDIEFGNDYKDFVNEFNELNMTNVDVEFYEFDLDRKIKNNGQEMTAEECLEEKIQYTDVNYNDIVLLFDTILIKKSEKLTTKVEKSEKISSNGQEEVIET